MTPFLTVGCLTARATTSYSSGTVVDDHDKALLGANIVAVRTPTGNKYWAVTHEDGLFTFVQ